MKYEGFSGSDLHLTSFIASRQAPICGMQLSRSILSSFFVTTFLILSYLSGKLDEAVVSQLVDHYDTAQD